jgi:hypothetical protein
MKGSLKFEGDVPKGFETTGVTQAETTLKYKNISVKTKANKILVSGTIVTASSGGTGTSPAHTMLKELTVWKGTETDRTNTNKIVLKAELATLIHLHTIACAKSIIPSPVSATIESFLNPVLAGDATYKFALEIAINLAPGNYYAELKVDASTVLAGYTGGTVTANTSAMLEFVDLGIYFNKAQKVFITTETNTKVATPPANEIAFLCATELSSILRGLRYDGDFDAFQVRAVESRVARQAARGMAVKAAATLPYAYSMANPALAAGTVYYCFARSSMMPRDSVLEMSASTAVIIYWMVEE